MRIEIVVDEVQPLSGRVAGDGGPPVVFCGWLPLLRILEQLTSSCDRAPAGLGGQLAAGGDAELAEDV